MSKRNTIAGLLAVSLLTFAPWSSDLRAEPSARKKPGSAKTRVAPAGKNRKAAPSTPPAPVATTAAKAVATPVATPTESKKEKPKDALGALQGDMGKEPTYIKSDSLTLKSGERVFIYPGNVEVKQGDMTLTSDLLEGRYSEDNKIQQLIASSKVVIVKGENIKGNSEKAIYDAATDTVTMTENPELEQSGSVLTADVIKIFLKDDRSTAEGDVRVKLIKKDGDTQGALLDLKK
jgi:lipopolysaccharide transport protein LptA